ncbi:DUF4352 domain-containing protein [Deinococcus yavapaiensis]|uniref:Uncharacterized protein DUF4352 n=1 Tax=Deinococcus yavapaiensis KR-236 TaxID=694435 RepID=A0A318SB45_9DEIO|nr:DUF4352 domain-containing protein [Deinococcus yavapaiensis]PYE55440.1 uncharacterized protein DUF4352 [Deinococcus yavapaiensis KR-236]
MRVPIILPALTLALATTAFAANPPATAPAVMGTTQLDGQNAKIGQTFTIGKRDPINITLVSASYTTTRALLGTLTIVPKANEKLLVLRFTAHNPQKQDTDLYGLSFTAVDALDVNFSNEQTFVRAGTSTPFTGSIKPAQKVEVTAVIRVPASGVVPKLIVQRDADPVLRYDLRGVVQKLPVPFADPKDASGATALADGPAKMNVFYPVGRYDVKLEDVTFSGEAMNGRDAPSGKRLVLATLTIKNAGADEDTPGSGRFWPELVDADGEPVKYWLLAKGSRPEEATGRSLKPGEEYRVRLVFVAPQGVGLKSLVLREPNSHGLVFDLGGVK